MLPERRSRAKIYRPLIRLAAIFVAIGIAFWLFRSWQDTNAEPEIEVVDTRTRYERTLEEGDALDVKEYIEYLEEQTHVAVPIHIENLQHRLKLSERMLELTNDAKIKKQSWLFRLNALIDRASAAIEYGIPDSYVTALLRDEKNNPAAEEFEFLSLAYIGYSYATVTDFLDEKEFDLREPLRSLAFESYVAALDLCDSDDTQLAHRMSELLDLINAKGTSSEAIPFTESFIEKYDAVVIPAIAGTVTVSYTHLTLPTIYSV